MNFPKSICFLFLIPLLLSCSKTKEKDKTVLQGRYHSIIKMSGGNLPFEIELQKINDTLLIAYIINGKEKLKLDSTRIKGDSIYIPMEIFESEIVAGINDSTLNGRLTKHNLNKITNFDFIATYGNKPRFEGIEKANGNISGKWQTVFYKKVDSTNAIGVFEQEGNIINGTFLTPTGDYRYLNGNLFGDSLLLSTFNVSDLYLLKAKRFGDTLRGGLWSGKAGYKPFVAIKNEKAFLQDAFSLTYLKKGINKIDFTFPDLNGKPVSIDDEKFKGKVIVIQIMGSWCANCMDETNFLAPFYKKNKEKGLEVIGLSFEKSPDLSVSAPKLKKMIKRMGIDYTILLAGKNTSEAASAALPMLNKVMSFPTTIIIDKKGKVREVHTGFNGPGTGKYYKEFVEKFENLINKLLVE